MNLHLFFKVKKKRKEQRGRKKRMKENKSEIKEQAGTKRA